MERKEVILVLIVPEVGEIPTQNPSSHSELIPEVGEKPCNLTFLSTNQLIIHIKSNSIQCESTLIHRK